MEIPFVKYQGTGNDFILIDNRQRQYDTLDVALLCDPKFGIGADGLMLLQNKEGFDFEMVYYNSDGNISSMCGNGGRCIVDFAHQVGAINAEENYFIAVDGPHKALWKPGFVELQMKDVDSITEAGKAYTLNTGSPHYVLPVEDTGEIDILPAARAIRYNDTYKEQGINVNFMQIFDPTHIRVRTYERGVENETLSCGTGVTASAIALSKHLNFKAGRYTIHIETPGGQLYVKYTLSENNTYSDVWLCGPAVKVFQGRI